MNDPPVRFFKQAHAIRQYIDEGTLPPLSHNLSSVLRGIHDRLPSRNRAGRIWGVERRARELRRSLKVHGLRSTGDVYTVIVSMMLDVEAQVESQPDYEGSFMYGSIQP